MHLEQRGERTGAGRLVKARKAFLSAIALIHQVLDHELEWRSAAGICLRMTGLAPCRPVQHRGACLEQGSPSNCDHDASIHSSSL